MFTDALATAKIPVFDVASRYTELGEALLPLINPVISAKYGLEMASFILENVSVPPEVEQAIDKRSSMAAVGNLNDYVKFQMAQGMEKGAGAGGVATEMAVGLAMAQQMINQRGNVDRAESRRPRPRRHRPPGCPSCCRPPTRRKRSAVSEADVLAILESGELAGKKIGIDVAHQEARRSTSTSPSRAVRTVDRAGRRPVSRPCDVRRRSRKASLSRLRRAGRVESGQAEAGLPVLRHRVAVRGHARPGEIEELDLVRALREMPDDQRGWQTETRTVQCQSCKAVSVFDPKRVGQRCEFCGSPELVDYQEIKSPIRPQSLLPFKVAESAVREQIRRWYKSKWLAPGALKSRALVDTVNGVYIPYWTFDAQVVCPWEADAGHYYYTTESLSRQQGQHRRRGRCSTCAGSRRPASSSISSTMSRSRARRG